MQEQILGTSYATILGQMVRKLRESKKLDQKDIAEEIGVSIMTISRIENGESVLDVPQMESVAKACGVDPVEFFKDSLKVKKELEKDYTVVKDKQEINKSDNFAALSLAVIAGVIVGLILAKK